MALGWMKEQIKIELFSSDHNTIVDPEAFEIVLQKSGKTIKVEKDETIVDALLFNNVEVDYTCLQGTCGTCITNVIAGEVDHRDAILTEEEKLANSKMCLCVSRVKEGVLILDL